LKHYTYLIIGGGMTAAAALQGIRELDQDGMIGLVSGENNPPYNRPPLTKGLWKGKPYEKIWRKVDFPGVDLHLGRVANKLDPVTKIVVDDQGQEYGYDKLLLATGGSPIRLPFGGEDILYYRTVEDYHQLQKWLETRQKFAVIGGGFIGSEITAALINQGKEVVMVFPEEGIGWNQFPPDLSAFINDYYRTRGVELLPGETVKDMQENGKKFTLTTDQKRELVVDGVIAGIGIQPNIELAKSAGLGTEDGILVDKTLRTTNPDIFAAGDVAFFQPPILGGRLRVEHEENANIGGKTAGRNMAGAEDPYELLPMFYSDLFDLGYEAVGAIDPSLEVVSYWLEPFHKGVIYYLDHRRIRGILLWNIWDKVGAARELIQKDEEVDPLKLKGRLIE
jgi:3-phenylpropionate/trans-cinnamate dioxygenase ferredoxin reductase component